jgi:hypothetical protein
VIVRSRVSHRQIREVRMWLIDRVLVVTRFDIPYPCILSHPIQQISTCSLHPTTPNIITHYRPLTHSRRLSPSQIEISQARYHIASFLSHRESLARARNFHVLYKNQNKPVLNCCSSSAQYSISIVQYRHSSIVV